jgi:hypothetical protein
MPSKTLMAALVADALVGTAVTFVGLSGFTPLPWMQTLAVLAFSLVSCLVVNDTLKVAMIKHYVADESRVGAKRQNELQSIGKQLEK